jgi:hypothetical protein
MVPMVAVVNFFRSLYHETKNKISYIGTAPTCGQKLHEIAIQWRLLQADVARGPPNSGASGKPGSCDQRESGMDGGV